MINVFSTIRIITILLIYPFFYNCNRSIDISKVEITFNNEEMFFKKIQNHSLEQSMNTMIMAKLKWRCLSQKDLKMGFLINSI